MKLLDVVSMFGFVWGVRVIDLKLYVTIWFGVWGG